ncbi:Odorant receptor 51a [Blattella germanica]|nr:Odorant receptor 51a [Blattella germanica]
MKTGFDDELNKRVDLCMEFPILMLKNSGVWTSVFTTRPQLHKIHQRVLLVLITVMTITGVTGIYVYRKRIEVVFELLGLLISHSVLICKLYIFVYCKEDVEDILNRVRTNFTIHEQRLTVENKDIIKEVINKTRMIVLVFVSLSGFTTIFYFIVTPLVNIYMQNKLIFLQNDTEIYEPPLKILPVQLYIPFEIDKSPVYELVYLLVSILAVNECFTFTAIETIIMSLLIYIPSQYSLLCDSLRNATGNVKMRLQQNTIISDVCEFDSSPKHSEEKKEDNIDCDKDINEVSYNNINDNDGKNITEQIFQQEMEKYLRECVAHHQKLLEFTEKLDQLWEFAFFFQFMTVSLLICFIGFQAMSGPLDANLFKMLGYLVSVLFQIFIYCAFGSNLTAKSAEVFNAVYDTDWYNQNNSYKLITKMMIMRSQKPVFLTAGRFGALCLPLFTSMIRSSYSYLALLRQMQDS